MADIPAIKFAQRHKPLRLESTATVGTLNNAQLVSIRVRESIVYSPDGMSPVRDFFIDVSIDAEGGKPVTSSIHATEIPEVISALGGMGIAMTAKPSFILRHAFFDATPFIRFSLPDGYGGKSGFGIQIYNSDIRNECNIAASSFGSADPFLLDTIKAFRKALEMISSAAPNS